MSQSNSSFYRPPLRRMPTMFMFSLILFLVLPYLIESYIKVPLKRWNDRSTYCQPMYMPIAMKQSSNGIDDEYYGETRIPDDNLSNQVMGGEDNLLSKETDTFQDYSVFSSESFSALKGLASASLSIILSANTALINATTEVMDASKRGQNLWLVDSETRTLPFGENSTILWDIYVCQSKSSKERGASATLEAFQTLAPPSLVKVHPAILSKTKSKGPTVRVVHRDLEKMETTNSSMHAFEVNNVDSIDKVFRILTKHMSLSEQDVKPAAKECLKWMYRGNALMEKNTNDQLSEAIYCYTAALNTEHRPQRGVLFLLRATAYLKRAFYHQKELKSTANELALSVPSPSSLSRILKISMEYPELGSFIFQQITNDCRSQEKKFRQTKFRHGLYEFALLHAAQDALRATQILPTEAQAWIRAADALAELRKMKESIQYYEKAVDLDYTLEISLRPIIEKLKASQGFLEKARALGWSEDTLRLALDIA